MIGTLLCFRVVLSPTPFFPCDKTPFFLRITDITFSNQLSVSISLNGFKKRGAAAQLVAQLVAQLSMVSRRHLPLLSAAHGAPLCAEMRRSSKACPSFLLCLQSSGLTPTGPHGGWYPSLDSCPASGGRLRVAGSRRTAHTSQPELAPVSPLVHSRGSVVDSSSDADPKCTPCSHSGCLT